MNITIHAIMNVQVKLILSKIYVKIVTQIAKNVKVLLHRIIIIVNYAYQIFIIIMEIVLIIVQEEIILMKQLVK